MAFMVGNLGVDDGMIANVMLKCEYGDDAGGLRAKKTGKREGS